MSDIGNFSDMNHLSLGKRAFKTIGDFLAAQGILLIYAYFLPSHILEYFAFRRDEEKKLQDVNEQQRRSIGRYLADLEDITDKMGSHIKLDHKQMN